MGISVCTLFATCDFQSGDGKLTAALDAASKAVLNLAAATPKIGTPDASVREALRRALRRFGGDVAVGRLAHREPPPGAAHRVPAGTVHAVASSTAVATRSLAGFAGEHAAAPPVAGPQASLLNHLMLLATALCTATLLACCTAARASSSSKGGEDQSKRRLIEAKPQARSSRGWPRQQPSMGRIGLRI